MRCMVSVLNFLGGRRRQCLGTWMSVLRRFPLRNEGEREGEREESGSNGVEC